MKDILSLYFREINLHCYYVWGKNKITGIQLNGCELNTSRAFSTTREKIEKGCISAAADIFSVFENLH